MNTKQAGFGGLQLLAVVAAMAMVTLVAVPRYNAYISKAKLTEAFNLAGVSKKKLTEYYMVNGRFPDTAEEAEAMRTDTFSPPEFVREIVVKHEDDDHEVVVQVFLKEGVVENVTGVDQYIYVAGDKSGMPGTMVEWSCGAMGVDRELLPRECQI